VDRYKKSKKLCGCPKAGILLYLTMNVNSYPKNN